MKKVIFDFAHIKSMNEFYHLFADRFQLSPHFGYNLDALWDVLTGEIDTPVHVIFIHMSEDKAVYFSDIITLFQAAKVEMKTSFQFTLDPL